MASTSRPRSLQKWRNDAVGKLRTAREATLELIGQLSEAEIMRPRTQDRWSVKDVLGHLLSCDEETVRRFRLIAAGHGDRIFWFKSMADADRFNARTVAATRKLPLRTVLRRMERTRADLVARFERLPLEALRDPSHAYTVVDWLPTPGWTHEHDHVGEVKTWWRGQRPAAGRGAPAERRAPARRPARRASRSTRRAARPARRASR